MNRRTWVICGIVLAVIVIGAAVQWLLLDGGRRAAVVATIVEAINRVDAHPRPAEAWQPAVVDMGIYGGGQVRTGAESRARLELPEGMVRLSADTVFTVKESVTRRGKAVTTVSLQEGRLWANLTAGQPHEFTVEAGSAVAAVRDTRFSVQVAGGETLVSVAEGQVVLTAREQSVTVTAGQQATVQADRPPAPPEPLSDQERTLWAVEGEMPDMAPPTPTPTETATPAQTPSATPSETPTPSRTPAETATRTPIPTRTPTLTPMPTKTPTNTAMPTRTPVPTLTPVATPTKAPTPTSTPQPTGKVDTGMGGRLAIQGVVRDDSGKAAPNVYVTLTVYAAGGGGDRGQLWNGETFTDPAGAYAFTNLLIPEGGHYEVWFNGRQEYGKVYENSGYYINDTEIGGDTYTLDVTVHPVTGSALSAAIWYKGADGTTKNYLSIPLSPNHFIMLHRGTSSKREYGIGSEYLTSDGGRVYANGLAGGTYYLAFHDKKPDGTWVIVTSPSFEIPAGQTKQFDYTIP